MKRKNSLKKQIAVVLSVFVLVSSAQRFLSSSIAQEKSDTEIFHSHLTSDQPKPYVDVLRTPKGRNILRDSPSDHIHHHALMFAIKVDNLNFWEESQEKQLEIQEPLMDTYCVEKKTPTSQVEKINIHWKHENDVLLKETRTVEATMTPEVTSLIWTSELRLPDGKTQAVLGGNHYHGLGMRFDQSMDKNGKFFFSETKNSELIRGDEHLTPCRWAAYTASLQGSPVTVAVFDSPKNPKPMLAFTMGETGKSFAYLSATANLYREPLILEKNKKIVFRYGIAVWEGTKTSDDVQSYYDTTWRPKQ